MVNAQSQRKNGKKFRSFFVFFFDFCFVDSWVIFVFFGFCKNTILEDKIGKGVVWAKREFNVLSREISWKTRGGQGSACEWELSIISEGKGHWRFIPIFFF